MPRISDPPPHSEMPPRKSAAKAKRPQSAASPAKRKAANGRKQPAAKSRKVSGRRRRDDDEDDDDDEEEGDEENLHDSEDGSDDDDIEVVDDDDDGMKAKPDFNSNDFTFSQVDLTQHGLSQKNNPDSGEIVDMTAVVQKSATAAFDKMSENVREALEMSMVRYFLFKGLTSKPVDR